MTQQGQVEVKLPVNPADREIRIEGLRTRGPHRHGSQVRPTIAVMTLHSFRGRPQAANVLRAALLIIGVFAAFCPLPTPATPPESPLNWVIPYGGEFWKTPRHQAPLLSNKSSSRAGTTDFAAAIERVQHAFRPNANNGLWNVSAGNYAATISTNGLSFSIPAATSKHSFTAETTGIRFRETTPEHFAFAVPPPPWHVTGNTAQRPLPGPFPITEHIEASAAGVETTWIIGQRPNRPDDLIIDWALHSGNEIAPAANGWRVTGNTVRENILISHAIAVDSQGQRLTLETERSADGLSIIVPAEFLQSAAYPVAIDPLISVEFDLDQPVATPAPSAQFAPAIASDGTNYLVVWHDNRNGSKLDLYATRVTTNGVVLDTSGLAITTATNDQWFPTVAFNGTNYLVAWQDARNGTQDIFATRVTPDGVVLETNGLPVVTVSSDQRFPAVAALDGGFLVAWQDGRNGTANQDIYAARITSAGVLVETNGFVVSNASNSQSAPAVGVVGTNFVAAWHDFRSGVSLDVYAARITKNGSLLDANAFVVSAAANDQWNVAIAGNGATGLIAWQDSRNGTDDDLFAARINEAGTVLDPSGIPVSQQPGQQRYPAVSGFGSGYYVTWQDGRSGSTFDLYGTSVAASGTVSSGEGQLLSDAANDQRYPAIARSGDQMFAVWEDIRNGVNTDIVGTRIDADGTPLDPSGAIVSTVANSQETPAVASNGSIYLAVWRDYRADALGDIFGSRIAADGTVLDPDGLAICTASNYQLAPRVAASGNDFLVVWQDFRNGVHDDILGSRVTGDGSVLDPTGLLITTALGAQRTPGVAGNTNGYLVVWQDHRSGSSADIYGSRIGTDGSIQDAGGMAICTTLGDQKAPAVAGLNGGFFVAWEDLRGGVSNRVFGTGIQSSGQIAELNGFALSSVTGEQQKPRLAASTHQYLAVWSGATNATSFNIFGTRISESGIVLETNSLTINAATGIQSSPTAAAKGGDFMVVWEDQRVAGKTDIYSTRITSNGAILEPAGEMAAPASGNHKSPAIAQAGTDYLLVYQSPDQGNIQRAHGVIVYPAAQPTISLSPGAAQFVAGSGPVVIDPEALLVDGDSANFEGGTLTIDITANSTSNDRLSVRHEGNGPGQIGASGNQLSYEGVLIGFSTGGTSGTSPLFIIFSSSATPTAVEALARNITFNNVATMPFTQPRSVRFTLNLAAGSGQPTSRTVNVIDAGSMPLIVTQPTSQTTSQGGEVTLSVVASGSQPLRYQWRLNGVNISGATNATYTISNLKSSSAGTYTVIVSNDYDTVISEAATVTFFDIEMYAGLTIAGPIGSTYRIEYRPAIGDNTTWQTLTNVTLNVSPLLFFDTASNRQNQRFYRAFQE